MIHRVSLTLLPTPWSREIRKTHKDTIRSCYATRKIVRYYTRHRNEDDTKQKPRVFASTHIHTYTDIHTYIKHVLTLIHVPLGRSV